MGGVRNMNNKEKLVIVTGFFIVIVSVLSALSIAVNSINISSVPEWALPIVRGAIGFFTATPVIFGISYFRNILGYFRNWVSQNGTPDTQYQFSRYKDTIVKYAAFIGPFAAAIPPPYQQVGTAIGTIIALVVDIVVSEFTKAKTPT